MEFFMPYGTILTKGELDAGATDFPVVPKQFILMSGDGGAKRLLVRLENRRKERLSSLCLAVRQYDIRGSLIRKDTYEVSISVKQGEFAPERDFPISSACEDFRLEVVSASFGSYKYLNKDGKAQVVYENKAERALADRTPAYASMHERRHYARARTLRTPHLFIPMVLLFAIVISLFVAIRIQLFKNENEAFTLDGMKYMLTSKDEDCRTVSFIGYFGDEEKITVPDSVEGYEIVSIAKHALKGSAVKELTVEADCELLPYALAECSLVSVSLPNINEIGEGAFKNSGALTTVTLSDTLTAIGKDAFFGCSSLGAVELPDTLSSLGEGAFAGCSSLVSLTVGAGVESIGTGLLTDASSLKTLALPYIGKSKTEPVTLATLIGALDKRAALDTLTVSVGTTVAKEAFAGESTLRVIKYLKPITEIGESAFSGCSSLLEFSVPAECTAVGSGAFSGCSSLKALEYKASATAIPDKLLLGCSSLSEFSIPATVTSLGNEAFFGCSSLKSLTLGEAVESVGVGVIGGCTSLERLSVYKLPEGVTPLTMCAGEPLLSLKLVSISRGDKLDAHALEGFTSLKSLYLPNELLTIGERALAGCSSLEIMSIPSGVGTIGKAAFSGCSSLPSVVVPTGVGELPDEAFFGCSALVTAELPRELNKIGNRAFSGCTGLSGISLGDSLVTLGESAFSGCTSLSYASLGSSVEYVSKNAFSGCTSLGSVSLPSNIKALHDGAFSGCSSVTVLTVPSTVLSIGEGVFEGCSSLRELSVAYFGASKDTDGGKVAYLFADKVPASLRKLTVTGASEIKTGALDGLSSLEEIVLTTCTVTEIDSSLFKDLESLRKVLLPISVEKIEESAFWGCTSLVSINFPESLRVIEDRAFYRCSSLSALSLNTGLNSIGIGAFAFCYELSSVSIPAGVQFIGDGSFLDCRSLASYSAPFTGISKSAPRLMTVFGTEPESLRKITVTDGDTVGSEAFLGFSRVTDITVPASVKSIGDSAFSGCSSLVRVNIPTVLKSIGKSAFSGCSSIKAISLPEQMTDIGEGAFAGCSSLGVLELPFVGLTKQEPSLFYYLFGDAPWKVPASLKTVTVNAPVSLVSQAFANLSYLEEIILEGGVNEIGAFALANCPSLRSVTLSGNLTGIGNGAFEGSERLRTVVNKTGKDISDMLTRSGAMNYALAVASDESQLSYAVKDGFTMLLADDGSWYLVDYDIAETGSTLIFPSSFAFGADEITSYKIASRLIYVDENLSSEVKSVHISSAVSEICDRAFMGSYVTTLTADANSTLTSIGASAFSGCRSLTVATVPAAVTEIGDGAFAGCESLVLVYNLSTLAITAGEDSFGLVAKHAESVIRQSPLPMTTVTVGDFVLEGAYDVYFLKEYIGDSFVADIRNLSVGNDAISSVIILKDAFRGTGVRRVILGECVSRIHDGAFDGACSIYEIVSLSTRVTPDLEEPDGCGGIAKSAIKIFTSPDDEFTYYTEENATGRFLFAVWGSEVYLVEAEPLLDTLVLPDTVGTQTRDYSVFKTALSAEELSELTLVLPLSVVNIHSDITDNAANTTLMYLGTRTELAVILDESDFFKVLYYSECVHDDTSFTLGEDGMPTTERTETHTVTVRDASCTEDGEMLESCDICGGEWQHAIPSQGHSMLHGVCTACGFRENVTVTGDDLDAYGFLSVSGSTPFTLSDGVISASLSSASGTSILTVSALDGCTVSFDYAVSGEGAFSFVIRKGSTEVVKQTSAISSPYSISLTRGEALVIMLSTSGAESASAALSAFSVVYS